MRADRALREAGRSTHLDFAAPGADLVAALPGKGYTPVRGTSFAAPFVAARLAATGHRPAGRGSPPGKGKVGRGNRLRHLPDSAENGGSSTSDIGARREESAIGAVPPLDGVLATLE